MTTTNATELGYKYQDVMNFYEAIAINFYSVMVEAANAQNQALYATARGLANNVWTKPASENLFAQARLAEANAKVVIEQRQLEYQATINSIKSNWNKSKIVFATINNTSHYYQIPYHAGLNLINGDISINYMGKNYGITDVTYDEAIAAQNPTDWEIVNSNFSGGYNVINDVHVHRGNVYHADKDGDVVMGKTFIGDKIVTGNGNVVGNNNVVSRSSRVEVEDSDIFTAGKFDFYID
jgi:hypothetical protein